ncbi:MAG: hypothetical protein ICV85_04345, partial [Tolypothrix sp. T3-bin4]|nr:hypothetical protein [Tolypothrix sp. T3-bin4]
MLNFCREEDRKAIANKGNRKFFPTFVSPIISTILCFYATSPTLAQQSPVEVKLAPILTQQSPRPPLTGVISYGNQILLNGRTLPATWLQKRSKSGSFTTHLSDAALRQLVGVDLLNSTNPSRQPVQWFSLVTKPVVLSSVLAGGYRYLDITNFAKTAKWQMQVNSNTLVISTSAAKVTDISQSPQSSTVGVAPLQQARIVVNLDRPTPWQIRQGLPIKKALPPDPDTVTPKTSAQPNREWIITLDGIADPVLLQRYTTQEPAPLQQPNFLKQLPPVIIPAPIPEPTPEPTTEPLIQQVEVVNNQTIIHLSVPFGLAPRISTVVNPDRLIIDIRPDALVEKDITWAQGVRWRQQVVNLGTERFPVVWLEVNPRTVGLKLKPMVTNANTLTGTAPLIQTAQQYLPVAAINGGYFNRNNRLPLGAIRRDNQWLSSPILNRGAIAWNDSGQFYFGRLTLAETLATSNNQQLPILFVNSGYVQSGIARYTPAWGTYSFLTDNEIILVVQNNQVTNQFLGGKAGESTIPVTIPQNGYLLVLRGNAVNSAAQLPIGTTLRVSSATTPVDFSRYPNIVGAGPLLVQNNQIVLDAKAEKFSDAF